MSNPKISIIIPVYKVEKYLRRCLDSIVAQTFTDWECILIDDGSPDNSGKICDEYAANDERFRVFHQENQGVSAARNKGLDEAKGEWIGFVDSDDWVENIYLSLLYDTAQSKDADMIITGSILTDGEKKLCEFIPINGWLNIPKDFTMNLQSPWGKLFRMDICKKNNFKFPLNITVQEDLYFNFLFLISTKKIYGIANTPYNYFRHKESTLYNLTKQKIFDEVHVLSLIEKKLSDINAPKEWYVNFLLERKIYVKNELLFALSKPDISEWRNCYPDLSKYAVKSQTTVKRRIIAYLTYKKLDVLVKLIFSIWRKNKH